MMDFEYGKDGKIKVVSSASGATFLTDEPETGLFTLKLPCGVTVEQRQAKLNKYDETSALPDRRKPHVSEDSSEIAVDVSGTIPFGAQPCVVRRCRMTDSSLCVVADLVMKNAFPMEELSAGGLKFTGDFASVLFTLPPEENSVSLPAPVKKDVASAKDGDELYSSEVPPVILTLLTKNGKKVSFSTGSGYWRWINAARIGGQSRFTVSIEGGAVAFDWQIFSFKKKNEENEIPGGRNWRLVWSLEWGKEEKKKVEYKTVFDMASFDWSDGALAASKDGRVSDKPCFASSQVLNTLKKFVRSSLANAEEGDVFAIKNYETTFCSASAHVDRPKLKILAHWDKPELDNFLRWASRQLAAKGASIVLD